MKLTALRIFFNNITKSQSIDELRYNFFYDILSIILINSYSIFLSRKYCMVASFGFYRIILRNSTIKLIKFSDSYYSP